jgi:hypothetical protein
VIERTAWVSGGYIFSPLYLHSLSRPLIPDRGGRKRAREEKGDRDREDSLGKWGVHFLPSLSPLSISSPNPRQGTETGERGDRDRETA